MTATDRPDGEWMLVGRIVGAFGVRGEMKVALHTDYPQRLSDLDSLHIGPEHHERSVRGVRLHKGQALLSLDGIDTPEAAIRLQGNEIWIPREEAAELPEGHYFLEELLGLEVQTAAGAKLGRVTDVLRTGSNDVYVVQNGTQEILIPGIRDAVVRLDIAARVMIVAEWVLYEE